MLVRRFLIQIYQVQASSDMKNSKSFGIIAIAAVAVMLIASAAAMQEDAFAGKKKKYVQSLSQANDCGNGILPLNVYCQNLADPNSR